MPELEDRQNGETSFKLTWKKEETHLLENEIKDTF